MWYLGKVEWSAIEPRVILGALGQAVFSMSLGGTFMVVYGSYLPDDVRLAPGAVLTALGDTGAGLLAGLAIFPAVFALGLAPAAGPGLLFGTIPAMFEAMPGGAIFGLLVAGLTDNVGISRRRAVWWMAGVVLVLSVPPMLNLGVFVPWDLTFGSGMQTLGALFAVVAVGWCLSRGSAIGELAGEAPWGRALYLWIRWVIPAAILAVGVWWALTELFGVVPG